MSSSVGSITFDCANPKRMQEFWAAATGYLVDACQDDWASLRDPAGTGPAILFMKVPEGKTVKNRVHLDLEHEDPESEAVRLAGLGAQNQKSFERWTVLLDVEGNEFCVVRKV